MRRVGYVAVVDGEIVEVFLTLSQADVWERAFVRREGKDAITIEPCTISTINKKKKKEKP